jgi:GT2 family glycosyltransferase
MATTVPIAVIIPTYQRGNRVFVTLAKILLCDPLPAETWVHVDQSDGKLEVELAQRFPAVRILSSRDRLGPGGGRQRCLEACGSAYAVSFDDDSYPLDGDFFQRVLELFEAHADAAVIGARIWHRNQLPESRTASFVRKPSYTGCGYAIRLSAYRQTRGHVPRPVPYGMEETDIAILLFANNWRIYESGELRVFHDTELAHHQRAEITKGVIANTALYAFLHYPVYLWPWGLLQLGNMIWFCIKKGRLRGILPGLASIPADCVQHLKLRRPLPHRTVRDYLVFRRSETQA